MHGDEPARRRGERRIHGRVGEAVDVIEECHPIQESVGLHFGPEGIDGDERTARVEMRYDWCKAFDL